ncbi:MAG: hypothetical protein ACLP19_05210 [Xanthobacteraceae bacterium]
MSTINVTYKMIDGAHFFVTTDKEAAGFCVANTDLQKAFNEVSLQLNALFEFNHGQKFNFHPSTPFETFKMAIEGSQLIAKGADQSGAITAAMIQPWMTEQVGK